MSGFIAAGSVHAAEAGARALREGGNAVDAAVAAMVTAFIAEPCLTSPGGAGIAQLYDPQVGRASTFDFFAQVPGLPADRIDPEGLDFVSLEVDFGSDTTQVFHVGKGATAVPGCLPGLLELHRRQGKAPLAQLLEEAQRQAEEGLPTTHSQAHFFNILKPILTYSEGLSRVFAPLGHIAKPGELIRSRRWALTLEWIRAHGRDPLSEGPLRDELLDEWAEPAGLLTEADLDAYRTRVSDSRVVPYRGAEVLLPGYPSIGGSMVGFGLRLLEGIEMPADPASPARFRRLAAAMETALEARADSGVVASAQDLLHWLDDSHVDAYRDRFEQLFGAGGGGAEDSAGLVPGNTTHVSVVDGEGRAVSITTSNGESCGILLPGLGLGMNNFLGEDDINPLGFHVEPPGRRLTTMMCPALVRGKNGSITALGTGGSNRIRSAVLQAVSNLLDYGMAPEAATRFPRIHRERDSTYLETLDLPAETVEEVSRLYPETRLFAQPGVFFGGVHMATRLADGSFLGAGDPRRDGNVDGCP